MIIAGLTISLGLTGVTSTFPCRKPPPKEYKETQLYELTYPEPESCPHNSEYAVKEAKYIKIEGKIQEIDRNKCQILTHDEERLIFELNR
jgi:hypothetical protein